MALLKELTSSARRCGFPFLDLLRLRRRHGVSARRTVALAIKDGQRDQFYACSVGPRSRMSALSAYNRAPKLKGLLARYRCMASTASSKSTEAVKQTAKSVEQQTRKVADTARELKHSSARIEDSADRTTVLAADRNILASERTYAAWVRTGLLALAGGIGARALKDVPNWLILANGTLLIGFGLFCFGAAVWRHFHPCPSRKSYPGVAMMQPGQDRCGDDSPRSLGGSS